MALVRISQIFAGLEFTAPKQCDVLIFDVAGASILENLILDGLKYDVFYARLERVCAHYKIIWAFILSLRYLKLTKLTTFLGVKQARYLHYALARVIASKAKVVITFTDNEPTFCLMSRIYKRAVFMAVQNGARGSNEMGLIRPRYLQHFFCWGQGDKDFYESHAQPVQNYYRIGSLRGDQARRALRRTNPELEFDVCLVSQWTDSFMIGDLEPSARAGILRINEYFARFVAETGIKACIALCQEGDDSRPNQEGELAHYEKSHQGRVTLCRRISELSSYTALWRSRVALTFCSSLGVEAFGWGKKVLHVNLTGDPLYDFPHRPGPWRLGNCDYETFKNALIELLNADQASYEQTYAPDMAYFMTYPKDGVPNGTLVRHAIDYVLRAERPINCLKRLPIRPLPKAPTQINADAS